MIKIIECSDEIINKIPSIMGLLYNIFGDKDINLYAVLDDDVLSFLARVEQNCVYIAGNKSPLYFNIDELGNIVSTYLEPYTVCFGDELFLIDSKKNQHFLNIHQLGEPDDEGYTGLISYKQYDEENDVMCEINFQQMFRERDGKCPIYHFHTNEIDSVYIDEKYKFSPKYGRGILPKRAKYYSKIAFCDDEVGYTLVSINENGLINTLKNGAYELLREPRAVRYVKTSYIDIFGNFGDTWPFAKQLKEKDMRKLIEDYGFTSTIPRVLIDIYNGDNFDVNLLQKLALEMKKVEEKDTSLNSRMRLTLKITND